MTFIIIILCITSLVLLITWAKVHPFLAFLIVSIVAGLLLGIPLLGDPMNGDSKSITKSITKGIGDTLGSLVIVIVLGAMLGKLVAESGAAQRIARVFRNIFGQKYLVWAMTLTGFVVGIPLYYNVGFVLLIPIIFSVAHTQKMPLVFVGLPMLTSLSVMHGFLPPHPAPMALVIQFHADMATTFFYGFIIAIPAILIAGPLFSTTLKKIKSTPLAIQSVPEIPEAQLPSTANSLISSLLPVLIIAGTALLSRLFGFNENVKNISAFIGDSNMVMLIALVIATYTLGINMGKRLSEIMSLYVDAVKDIAIILLIIGSAGILKQVFVDSGVSNEIATLLLTWKLPTLLLAWLVTAVLRLCLGSATIAGLTAVVIILPIAQQSTVDINLLVLSIGAGSLFCSHVNDTAFWMFKEYFGLTLKDTFRSWTLMETIVSIIGLIGVLLLNTFIG